MIRDLVKRLKLDALSAILVDEGKRVRGEVLTGVRDSLRREIDRIDARIADLSGGAKRGARMRAGGRRKKGAGPRREDGTLKDAIVRAFQETGSSLHVNDLTEKVKEVGFKTRATARNLAIQAYRALKDRSLFKKLGKGTYALKG